jgi:hypothetical protein
MRIILAIVAVCFSLIAAPPRADAQVELLKSECGVHGTVVNIERAVWPNVEVTYSSLGSKQVAVTDENGDYQVQLSPGIYNVTVRFGLFNVPNFERSKVVHLCPETLIINLWIHPWCASGCDDHAYSKTFGSDWTGGSHQAVLTYLSSKKSKLGLVYKSALLTYKNQTLFADEITTDSKHRLINAKGNVVFENGTTQETYEQMIMRFGADDLIKNG